MAVSTKMRSIRAAAACVAVAAVGFALSGAAVSPGDDASGSSRDPSGLLIVAGHDWVVPAALRDAYGLANTLSVENPDAFGVPTVSGDRVRLAAAASSSSTLAGAATPDAVRRSLDAFLAQLAQAPAARGIANDKLRAPRMSDADRALFATSVAVETGGRSRAQTYAMSDAVFDLQFDARYRDAHIWQSEVDPLDGTVLLSVEKLTPELAQAITTAYGTDSVRVQVAPQPTSYPAASRPHDTSPHWGGALIGTPSGICTSGFSWVSGSTSMMISAGHCYPSGGNVQIDGTTIGTVASGSAENWTNGTGTVYLTGQSTYRGDISLITMSSGHASSGYIYRGDSASSSYAAVGEMWSRSPVSGDQFCTGGSQSGEICDWTVSNVGINHTYSDGQVLRNGVETSYKQGWCVRPGDSGGPVYTVRSDGKVAAKGIINGAKGIINGAGGGGSDYYGGLLDQCIMWFTDIYQPYYAFPGTLRTS